MALKQMQKFLPASTLSPKKMVADLNFHNLPRRAPKVGSMGKGIINEARFAKIK